MCRFLLMILIFLSVCIITYARIQSSGDGKERTISRLSEHLNAHDFSSKRVLILHSFEGNAPVFMEADKAPDDYTVPAHSLDNDLKVLYCNLHTGTAWRDPLY